MTDIIRGWTLELLTIQSLNAVGDMMAYSSGTTIFNATRVNSYSPTDNFIQSILNTEAATYKDFKTTIYQCIANVSDLLAGPLNNLWDTVVYAPNFGEINQIQPESQNITFL